MQTTITMVPGEYMPGRRPGGVGPSLKALERAVEEYRNLHPHVTIVLRQVGGADLVEGEYIKTQIMGGIAPDIVQINTEAVWPDIDKGWWISFDEYFDQPNPYIAAGQPGSERWWNAFANVALTKAKRAPNGKLYSLTMDLVETGIFYNRDLFRALDLSVPQTWAEFLELQQMFKDAGYVPLAVSIHQAVDWAQDFLFDQMYYPILDQIDRIKGTEDEEEYMQGYLYAKELAWNIMEGNISSGNVRYREMWKLMREWRQFWPRDLLNTDSLRLFLLQRSPMTWQASPMVRRLLYDELAGFEWGVFYLPPITEDCHRVGSGVDPAVIGGAGMQYSVTRMAKDRGHLDQVMDFLAFLTTPERGGAMVNEAGLFIPNVAGFDMSPALEPFQEIIRHRYGTTKWVYTLDNRFNDTNHRLIDLFLGDYLSLDEFLKRMDQNNRSAAKRMIEQEGWSFEGAEWQ
jgi:raffinose/stachyose/melibiose transport system substrate-binding protein